MFSPRACRDKRLAHWIINGDRWKRHIANERARSTRNMLIIVGIVGVAEWLSSSSIPETTSASRTWTDMLVVVGCLIGINLKSWSLRQMQLLVVARQATATIYYSSCTSGREAGRMRPDDDGTITILWLPAAIYVHNYNFRRSDD